VSCSLCAGAKADAALDARTSSRRQCTWEVRFVNIRG
jgi:hypothetical protein